MRISLECSSWKKTRKMMIITMIIMLNIDDVLFKSLNLQLDF